MQYRSDIQGLRAVAVLVVILFHFNPALLPGGFVGVDVFLVISGFLIVSILLRKKTQPSYELISTLQYFYIIRIKRIAPAYFVMLAVVSLIAAILFLPQDLAVYLKSLNKSTWFSSNHYFAEFGDYFTPANYEQPLLHTWSLAVEIQFYILIPLIVLILSDRALKLVLIASLVCLTAYAHYRLNVLDQHQATYFSLWARLPEFFAGGLVALYSVNSSTKSKKNWLGSFAGMVLILGSAFFQPQLGSFPGMSSLLPVSGAVLILRTPAEGFAQQVLGNRIMVCVGELSYSLYLWHWPVLALLRYYTGAQVLSLSFSLLFVVITLLMAILSFYLVERPMRVIHTWKYESLAFGALMLVIIGVIQTMPVINQIFSPPRLPVQYQRYADDATICHGKIVRDSLKGDHSSRKEVLVLGDSHAAQLNLFFDHLGKELGFKANIITASSCVTIPGFDYKRIPEWAQKPCLDQIDEAKIYLLTANCIFLAAMWSYQLPSEDFQKALNDFLAEQSKLGKKIFILDQVPMLTMNPIRFLRFKSLGINPHASIDREYQKANSKLHHIAARHPSVVCLNFESSGLFDQAPFVGSELIYYDKSHLNEEGVKRYAGVALSEIKKIIEKKY